MYDGMLRNLLIVSTVLVVSGCLSQSQIQSKYMSSQSDCRTETARLLSSSDGATNPEQGQAAVATGFSDCMTKSGWHLTTQKPGTAVAQNPPTGSPSTNPSAATSAVRTVPAQNPPAQTAAAENPPSGAPSVNPIASAASIRPAVAPSAGTAPLATYQPARPTSVAAPSYGTGAGRSF